MGPVISPWLAELVVAGTDDWILATDVLGVVARSESEDPVVLRAGWIGLVSEGVALGLLEPGHVAQGSFHPWGLSMADAVCRMIAELDRIGIESIGLGDVVWLRNTAEGEAAAERLLADGWEPPDE